MDAVRRPGHCAASARANLTEADPGYYVPGTTITAYCAVKGARIQGVDMEVTCELTTAFPPHMVRLMARHEFYDKLSATPNITNLFDKKYIASVSDWWYSGH